MIERNRNTYDVINFSNHSINYFFYYTIVANLNVFDPTMDRTALKQPTNSDCCTSYCGMDYLLLSFGDSDSWRIVSEPAPSQGTLLPAKGLVPRLSLHTSPAQYSAYSEWPEKYIPCLGWTFVTVDLW